MSKNKSTKVIRSERIVLPREYDFTEHCSVWREIYNCGNYIQRQLYFKRRMRSDLMKSTPLARELEKHPDCPRWKATIGRGFFRVIVQLFHDWSSYFKGLNEFSNNRSKFLGEPQPPGYIRNVISGHVQGRIAFHKEQMITTPSRVNVLTGSEVMLPRLYGNVVIDRHLSLDKEILSGTLKPIGNRRFELSINYRAVDTLPDLRPENRVAAIDLGMKYAVTMVDNLGSHPITISGGKVLSINQWFNKNSAKLYEIYDKTGVSGQSGSKLERLERKRYARMGNYLHCVARRVIQWCMDRDIDTIVIGLNPLWKQNVNKGKRFNQNFSFFPYRNLIDKISNKAELSGIRVVVKEEGYTSKCSFLDDEPIGPHSTYLGSRGPRGLFQSSNGTNPIARVHGEFNHPFGCECGVQYWKEGIPCPLPTWFVSYHSVSKAVEGLASIFFYHPGDVRRFSNAFHLGSMTGLSGSVVC